MPVVSVVIIFLNAERYIEEAVHSVYDQEFFSDWELILVDDGSTDRSSQIARDLAAADERVHYLEHPGHQNRGMSATRNLGAAHAKAKYIAFLDADDTWTPRKLYDQVELLERMPDVAMVSGAVLNWYSWDPKSTIADSIYQPGDIADQRLDPPEAALALNPLRRGTSAIAEVLVRREAFEAVGGFEERFRGLYEDQAFYVKIFLRYPIYISSSRWLYYRMHDDSCCGQLRRVSRAHTWRLRLTFFDWIRELEEQGWFDDARVSAKLRLRRRELKYALLASPIFEFIDRLNDPSGPFAYISKRIKKRRRSAARSRASVMTDALDPST